jgi:DNA-binding response OmpR family regulator
LAPLDELASCDCAIDGCRRIIQREGAKARAFCANGSAAPLEMDPEHLRQFRVQAPTFQRMLRTANQLDEGEITEYTPTLCFLGRMQIAEQKLPVVLACRLRSQLAGSLIFEVRKRLGEKPVIVLTPTSRPLDIPSLQDCQKEGLVVAAISELLTRPGQLALDRRKLESLVYPARSASADTAILRLNVGRSLCWFKGAEVTLSKMPFDVLELLAREAQTGPGWVSRDRIFERCWHEDWERGIPPNDEQITKMVSEVRNALRDAGGLSLAEARRLVQPRSKVGYRLNLKPDEVELLSPSPF